MPAKASLVAQKEADRVLVVEAARRRMLTAARRLRRPVITMEDVQRYFRAYHEWTEVLPWRAQ